MAADAFANGGFLKVTTEAGKVFEVPFKQGGFPNFTRWIYDHPKATLKGMVWGKKSKDDIAEAWRLSGLDRAALKDEWVWHHTEELGTMILVRRDVHRACDHTGGAAIFRAMLRLLAQDPAQFP